MAIKITGTGSITPSQTFSNTSFLQHDFFDANGESIPDENKNVIEKFQAITGIEQRKYAEKGQLCSDIASVAATKAIEVAKIDPETLDYIIVAHNVGDIIQGTHQIDNIPSVASKVKANLGIKAPSCVAYDILFGCPGWVEGVIQAKAFIKAKMAKKCLVIGTDTLSRVLDDKDRDSMIFADGAGATVIEEKEASGGILSHKTMTFTAEGEADYIFYGPSNDLHEDRHTRYIKMQGRKVYEFALLNVPKALKSCLDEADVPIENLKKVSIHQANQKMDEAIVSRFYRLYKQKMPEDVLPMNIQHFGNSSVATVPTLFDLVLQSNYGGHSLKEGDVIIFASVGAGMNINAIVYQM